MSNETILGLLIVVILINIIYVLYYYGVKKKKREKENISNRQKQLAVLNGVFIIISFLIIVLYELLEYKYAISWHPNFGNILIGIKYIAYFVLMITVTIGQIYYAKYRKELPKYINVIYYIGIVLLTILALYIYIVIEIESSNAGLM